MKNNENFKNIYTKWYINPRLNNNYDISNLQKDFKVKYNNGMFRELTTITIETIRQCNLDCQMCSISEAKDLDQKLDKMSLEEYKNIIDNLPKTVKNITPNGIGEGFIHSDFLNILKYTKEQGYNVSVNTNGIYFKLEALDYLDEIIFSLDSAIKEELLEIRLNIEYERLLRIIKESKQYIKNKKLNTTITVNAVISSINYKNIDKLFKLVDILGIENLNLSPASNYFSIKTNKFHDFEKDIEKNTVINWDKIVNHLLNYNYKFNCNIYYPNIRKGLCSFGFNHLFIDNNSNVSLCCIHPRDTIIGNLKQNSFDDILNSKELSEYKKSQLNLTQYNICDICTTGMPYGTYNKLKRKFMKIGIVLPDSNLELLHLKVVENLTSQYFKNCNEIILYSLNDSVNYYNDLKINVKIIKPYENIFNDNTFFSDINSLIIMRDKYDNNPSFSWDLNLAVYKPIMFGYGGLRQISGEKTIQDNRSIFHNIAQKDYTYFPYTFLHPRNMFNDENSLGFRMTEDISYLENRNESHIVIAIFGGSAAYDMININSFSSQIEVQLNTKYKDKEVTVLNFGLCGGLILNEMILYMLFAWKINPDIVISYSGFNDLLMGQFFRYNSSKDYNIAYSHIYRNWASQLYNTDNEETFQTTTPSDIVIKSYYEREKEFEDIITNRGKKFISILQPMIYSKKQLSENEKFYSKLNTFKGMDLALHNMKVLYEKYLVYLSDNKPCKYYLNLHNEFKQYGDQYTFFADTVHTMPEGSNTIANHISKYLKGVIDD